MADNRGNNINIKIGYTIDKKGLEEMQSYFQQIANRASEPGANISAGLKQAGETAKTLDGILDKTFNTKLGTLNVTKFNQEMQKAGLTLKQVKADLAGAGNQGSIAFNKLAQSILTTNVQLKQSNKLLDSMFTTFKNTIRYGISSSIFNNFTNSIQKAYDYTRKLNSSLNDIRIVTGKSAEEMDGFADKANKVAKQLSASTLDVTNAALIYYQQGLGDTEAQARAETTVKVANVTGQKADEVSEQLTAVWNGYQVSAEEAEMYIDKLAKVATTTASDLEELSIGMSKVASAASAMGVDFDDLTAQIATIVSVTRQAPESVGTALKTIYARIGDLKVDGVDEFGVSLGEVSSQMKTMGIDVLDPITGNMRDMSDIMSEVADKWNTWTEAQQQAAAVAIAGKRQYNNLMALMENWGTTYARAMEASKNSLGTLTEQQNIYEESTNAKLTKLRATWQGLYKDVGNTDSINFLIDQTRNLVTVLNNFTSSFGGGFKSLLAMGTVIANMFSKQIATSIANATQRANILKQNLEQIKMVKQLAEVGVAEASSQGLNSTNAQAAAQATQEQLEHVQRIYDLSSALSEEETNRLLNLSQRNAKLTEEEIEIRKTSQNYANIVGLEKEYSDIMRMTEAELEEREQDLTDEKILEEEINKEANKRYETYKNIILQSTGTLNNEKKLKELTKNLTLEQQRELNTLRQGVVLWNDKAKLAKALEKNYEKYKEAFQEEIALGLDEKEILENRKRQYAKFIEDARKLLVIEEERNNNNQEADAIMSIGRSAAAASVNVTSLISSLSSLAMTWSSITSLYKTWNDENATFGEKLSQTFITLGFAIPSLVSAFSNLNKAYKTYLAIRKDEQIVAAAFRKSHALDIIEQTNEYVTVKVLNGGKEEHIRITMAEINANKHLAIQNGQVTSTYLLEAEAADFLTAAKIKLSLAIDKVKTALTAEMSALATFASLATVAVAAIAITVSWYKKQQEARLKEAQTIIDTNKAKQEEIKANEELYKSYEAIAKKYAEGAASKEEIGKAAEELAKKYKLEGIELAKLTGDYAKFNQLLKEARQQEYEEATKSNIDAESAVAQKMNQASRKGLYARALPNLDLFASDIQFGAEKGHESFTSLDLDFGGQMGRYGLHNIDDAKQMLALYDKINAKVQEASGTPLMNDSGYKKAKEWLENMKESAEEARALYNSQATLNMDVAWDNLEIDATESYEDFNNKLDHFRNIVKQNLGTEVDDAIIDSELATRISNSSNAMVHFNAALKDFEKQAKKVDMKTLLATFSQKDWKALAEGGLINLSDLINYDTDTVIKLINNALHSIDEQDLDTVISLRAKITSDKKLNKKEIEEALGEQSKLLEDETFGAYFADFDNMSALEQVEVLNGLIADRINLSKEWESQQKEEYSTKVEQEKKIQEELQKEIDEQRELMRVSNANTAEQRAPYEKKIEELNTQLEESKKKVKDFAYAMSQAHFNEESFKAYIAGVDGVISEVKTLQGLLDDIGEGWTLAADKVEEFAKTFPELMKDQRNYNYLQDGSLQISEQGQEAFKEMLELRKEEIVLQNESYKKELAATAEKKLAEYEYYKNMAQHLKAFAEGQENEVQLEANLKKGLEEYKVRMMNITGMKDDELNKIIQKNNIKTTNLTIDNVKEMYKAYQQLGSAIAACQEGQPVPDWGLSRDSAPEVDTVGHEITFETNLVPPKLDKDTAKKLARYAQESADLAYNEYSTAISKMSVADAHTNSLLLGIDNLGKNKKKDNTKYEDEFDRYYDIKKAIDLVSNALDKLSKIQEKLHGKELIQSLKNENDLIRQQAKNYELLYQAQENELSELQTKLSSFGAEFDANGYLTNYATLTKSIFEQYQALLANGLAEEAKTFYEQSYEDFKKYLERYDTLFYSEMKDTRDKLDEENRKLMENNLKIWETGIQIRLDTSQAKRDWSDFLKEINSDFRKVYKNLNIEMSHLMTKVETYAGFGTIQTDLEAIQQVMTEIDKLAAGQGSDMFESISDAQEKLKELDKTLEDDAKNMKSLWEEAWNTYLEGIDQAGEKLDFVNDRYEKIDKELEFQSTLINLLYGEEAYKLMSKLYQGQEEASRNHIQSIKEQADMWHQLWAESGATLENQSEWTADQQKYYENWQTQQSKLNDLVTSYIELLQKDYLNTVNDVLASLEKTLTGGSTLERVKEQWERITSYSDKYFDSIEQAYEAQKFANKINQDIAKMNDIKNQQKLQTFRDKEITYLREKENLTKYDLDAAEARYQIALKEIALQEAQENKTSMKLVRNEQGNWSYQYMADADEVSEKQNDLLNAFGDLYKLAGDAYQDNLDSAQELANTYIEKVKEIHSNQYMAEEEKEQRLLELRTWYMEEQERLVAADQLYREDLQKSGSGLLLQIYKQDEAAYDYMTTSERAMVDGLVKANIADYQKLEELVEANFGGIGDSSKTLMSETRNDWTATARDLIKVWTADDGVSVKSAILNADKAISIAMIEYTKLVHECALQVERDFGEQGIGYAINYATKQTNILESAVADLINRSISTLGGLKSAFAEMGTVWESTATKINSAINAIQRYLAIEGKIDATFADTYTRTPSPGALPSYVGDSGDGGEHSGQWIIQADDVSVNRKVIVSGAVYSSEAAANTAISDMSKKQGEGGYRDLTNFKAVKATEFKYGDTDAINQSGLNSYYNASNIGPQQRYHSFSPNATYEDILAHAVSFANSSQFSNLSYRPDYFRADNFRNSAEEEVKQYYITANFPDVTSAEQIKQALLTIDLIARQESNKMGVGAYR